MESSNYVMTFTEKGRTLFSFYLSSASVSRAKRQLSDKKCVLLKDLKTDTETIIFLIGNTCVVNFLPVSFSETCEEYDTYREVLD